jgi:hypothetical protein
MVGAVEIDDPKIGDAAVGRDVFGIADINDAFAVGRDLGVGGDLDMEEVHGFETREEILSEEGRGGEKQGAKDDGRIDFAKHGVLLRKKR